MKQRLKKFTSCLLATIVILGMSVIMPVSAGAISSKLENAVQWAIRIANDNTHGYSQSNRWGPDYDCSSFVISALKSAGISVGSASYTGNMKSELTKNGFTWISWSQIGSSSKLQRGDILFKTGHTELYIGNNQIVGAHSDRGYPQTGDQTGTEISVTSYYSGWDGVLRYNGGNTSGTTCNCSTSYKGNYKVTTNSSPLTMRSGHGTSYSVVTSIPKGSTVSVSKANGSWAHVTWNGYSGYCSMQYLTKIS